MCHVICIYGHSSPSKAQAGDLSELLSSLQEQLVEQGQVQVLVCGDFNLVSKDIGALRQFERAGWQDLSDKGTCLTAHSKKERHIALGIAVHGGALRPGGGQLGVSPPGARPADL